MDPQLTPDQSLRIIQDMVLQAKKSFHRMSFYFLLWGVLLTLAMVAQLITATFSPGAEGVGWVIASVVGAIASGVHGAREGRREQVETLADRVLMWMWIGFMITLFGTMAGAGIAGYSTPVGSIMLLTGLPTFTTGQMLRFRPLIIGGVLFWVLGIISFHVDPVWVGILNIAGMVFGYIVPGYMLKRQEDGVRTA
ncbi:MAG: hypothetical protein JNL05_02280 [Flavobacteriales bacterium]|nr:hypothetical protein [Flavobacteriales bacterium]